MSATHKLTSPARGLRLLRPVMANLPNRTLCLPVALCLCLGTGLSACRKSDAASGTDLGTSQTDETQFLDLALQAEQWVAAGRIETSNGIEWSDLPRHDSVPYINTPRRPDRSD